jgi:creatinine amidohydrolase
MGDKTVALRKSLYGDSEGYHATPSEVAVTWHAFPDQQRYIPLGPLQKVTRSYRGPEDFRELFPDGRMASDPSLAKPEDGARLVDLSVEELSKNYRTFLNET